MNVDATVGNLTGFVQCHQASRFIQGPAFGRTGVSRFEVHDGDVAIASDGTSFRERCEFQSKVTDTAGASNWMEYTWDYLLNPPNEYTLMTPKQILGQWFDKTNGEPLLYMRMENAVLQFFMNSKLPDAPPIHTIDVPYSTGVWNSMKLEVKWGKGTGAASFRISRNGVVLGSMLGISLVKPTATVVYAKFGVYRSDMDDWDTAHPGGELAPTLVAYYNKVNRKVLSSPPSGL